MGQAETAGDQHDRIQNKKIKVRQTEKDIITIVTVIIIIMGIYIAFFITFNTRTTL